MFYQPGKTDHGLRHDPFKACVVPRPIGWISTISATLTDANNEPVANLAPYSQFQNLTFDPPYVMFSANQTPENQRKDSVVNAEVTGIFCWQLATYKLREAVNISSEWLPYGQDEFTQAQLEKTYSTLLRPKCDMKATFKGVPMVAASPIRFECEYHSTVRLPGNPPMGSVDIVIGKVVGVHIDDGVIGADGKIDVGKTLPIARCGYYDYAVVRETFEMMMPDAKGGKMREGLEGRMQLDNSGT